MFDIGAAEILVIAIVAILVIGPKDMPLALRTAGRWIGQVRRVSSHFRAGIDAMVREAEIEEMEKKWQERNAQIMREHPDQGVADDQLSGDKTTQDEMRPLPAPHGDTSVDQGGVPGKSDGAPDPDADDPPPGEGAPHAASAEARIAERGDSESRAAEPQLPLENGEKRERSGEARKAT